MHTLVNSRLRCRAARDLRARPSRFRCGAPCRRWAVRPATAPSPHACMPECLRARSRRWLQAASAGSAAAGGGQGARRGRGGGQGGVHACLRRPGEGAGQTARQPCCCLRPHCGREERGDKATRLPRLCACALAHQARAPSLLLRTPGDHHQRQRQGPPQAGAQGGAQGSQQGARCVPPPPSLVPPPSLFSPSPPALLSLASAAWGQLLARGAAAPSALPPARPPAGLLWGLCVCGGGGGRVSRARAVCLALLLLAWCGCRRQRRR